MGIDLLHKHKKKSVRRAPKSSDPYLKLLVKLYRFLARRTNSKFNSLVLRRLCMSRVNRPPVSTSKLSRALAKQKEGTTAVVVGTITDDTRFLNVPKLSVAALHVTASARARILKAGGEVLTFDQLALRSPTGSNTLLLRGRKTARTATRYFGAAGVPGSSTRPRVRSIGRKFERARGRRNSCGYKA